MKRGLMDLIIACVSLAIFILTFVYMQEALWLLIASGICFALFLILGIVNRNKALYYQRPHDSKLGHGIAKQLILLSEEDTELASWDLFGRTSLVIGRDRGENLVDVNLAQATYASFIDIEHAVMNYAGEQWYIEDLHSKNGIRVQKRGDSQQYKLAPEKPCKLEPGDVVYIAQTKLLVQ